LRIGDTISIFCTEQEAVDMKIGLDIGIKKKLEIKHLERK
jgi:hypothetical protein